jgi:hypothetical protein
MSEEELYDLTEAAARFGARMAARGLSEDQVASLMANARPALDEAARRVAAGEDVDSIRFELRRNDQ